MNDFELGALVVRSDPDGRRSRDVGVIVERMFVLAGERGFKVLFPVQNARTGAVIFFYGDELEDA